MHRGGTVGTTEPNFVAARGNSLHRAGWNVARGAIPNVPFSNDDYLCQYCLQWPLVLQVPLGRGSRHQQTSARQFLMQLATGIENPSSHEQNSHSLFANSRTRHRTFEVELHFAGNGVNQAVLASGFLFAALGILQDEEDNDIPDEDRDEDGEQGRRNLLLILLDEVSPALNNLFVSRPLAA
jgi:hypothetical protein